MHWFLLASGSALLSAAAAVMEKKALFRVGALEFSFLVAVMTAVLSAFIPFSVDVVSPDGRATVLLVVKSIVGGIAFLLVMLSLEHNQISDALPLLGLTPAAAALVSFAVTGESLKEWEWGGVVLMMAGTYALEKRKGSRFWEPFKAAFAARSHSYIFGALALFAVSSVMDKKLVSGYSIHPLVVLFYQHTIYSLLFACLLWMRRVPVREILRKGEELFPLLLSIALLTVGYRFVQLEATRFAPVALVLAVKRTSVLYASAVGGTLFSEERLRMKLLGGAMIVGSGFLILRNVM